MYWRALQELVNGPLNVANSAPLCNAKYNAFIDNGLSVEDPNASMLPWIACGADQHCFATGRRRRHQLLRSTQP